ncbi:MAG: DUF3576 domain-containing protein [Brevirhabdus sp.]
MAIKPILRATLILTLAVSVSGCGGGSGLFGGSNRTTKERREAANAQRESLKRFDGVEERQTIWDLFGDQPDPNTTVEVNKYIWNAAQDVLDFMPMKAADPFSGVIVYDYGTPPGSRRAYRAIVYVRDPALDARSLNVVLHSRSGPAPVATVRAIEDAILTRARQLRIADTKL